MRRYTQMSIVGISPKEDTEILLSRLSKKIEEFQVDEYGAEVQFQANGAQCMALVLQYKEV